MKIRGTAIRIGALGLLMGLTFRVAVAEEVVQPDSAQTPAGAEAQQPVEETEFTYGDVTSVSDMALVVNQYDYTTGEMKDMSYAVGSDVSLTNVNAISEIAVGDAVDVEYVKKDGKNVAVAIMVEKYSPDEELTQEDTTAEQAPTNSIPTLQ